MNNFEIIVDASCDLTKELRDRFGIAEKYVKGLITYPDGSEMIADLDWENTTPEEYFGLMVNKKALVKTAMVSREATEEVLEYYAKQGKNMLCITLSGGLSGTYGNAVKAAENILEKYPEVSIKCVDSRRYSTAEGLLAIYASQLRSQGKTLDETFEELEKNKARVHQIGMLDDLYFCNRMGRVSGAAAVMGTFIGIKPMADFGSENGMSTVVGKVRGYKAGFEAIVNYMEKTIIEPEKQIVFVCHSVREQQAKTVRDMIIERIHPAEVIIATVGQSCGATVGPGCIAAHYFGTPVSPDNVEEKAIFAEVTSK